MPLPRVPRFRKLNASRVSFSKLVEQQIKRAHRRADESLHLGRR